MKVVLGHRPYQTPPLPEPAAVLPLVFVSKLRWPWQMGSDPTSREHSPSCAVRPNVHSIVGMRQRILPC